MVSVEMLSPARAGRRLSAAVVAAIAGAFAVGLADVDVPKRPPLREQPFSWVHDPGETLKITPSHHVELPPFGDFELNATVELQQGATLDVVVRRVEAQEGEGYFGRFTVLRITTVAEGPAWRSREQALFGPLDRGVRVTAGIPASILLQAHGRHLRANVAGRWVAGDVGGKEVPWAQAADDWGGLAFVSHGGVALIHRLEVHPEPPPSGPPVWAWGALSGLIAAAALQLVGAGPWWVMLCMAIGLPLSGELARVLLLDALVPGAVPADGIRLLAALWLLPWIVTLALPRWRWWLIVLGAALSLLSLDLAARAERSRLEPLQDPRLELYFGEKGGSAPFDALARRAGGAGPIVHTLEKHGDRILLLGGAELYESQLDYAEQVGPRLESALATRLGKPVEAVVLPTPFGHALQQLLLFRGFYLGFDPDAVVFAASRFEGERAVGGNARARLERLERPPSNAPVLWQLWFGGERGEAPLATPADLQRVLDELVALAEQHDFALVLATEPETPAAFRAVVQRFAAAHDLPFVGNVVTPDGKPETAALVDVLAGALGG